jgi:hypothetical protein
MVDKLDLANFILEREKTSWGDLEKQFVNFPAIENPNGRCLKCGSSNIIEQLQASIDSSVEPEKTGFFVCGDCGKHAQIVSRIARQTLLNYTKTLITEGIIEKIIDKETLRPIYQATITGQEKLDALQNKKRIIAMIEQTMNLQETLKEILKKMEEKS